jgi:hypothetical protein
LLLLLMLLLKLLPILLLLLRQVDLSRLLLRTRHHDDHGLHARHLELQLRLLLRREQRVLLRRQLPRRCSSLEQRLLLRREGRAVIRLHSMDTGRLLQINGKPVHQLTVATSVVTTD